MSSKVTKTKIEFSSINEELLKSKASTVDILPCLFDKNAKSINREIYFDS